MNGTVTISINDYNALLTQATTNTEKYNRLLNTIMSNTDVCGDKGNEFLYFGNVTFPLRDVLKAIEPDLYAETLEKWIKEKEKENEKSTELPL